MPGLVEADDDGLYVVKFRGAGQGLKALIAEVIVGEVARALGLRVPEIVLVDVDPLLAAAEPDPEIQELVQASGGSNAALDFLPGSLPFSPAAPVGVTAELAAEVVWLDALTANVDRTPRNPNMLIWHGELWLIDHGAALYRHHAADVAARRRGGRLPADRRPRPAALRGLDRRGRRAAGAATGPRDAGADRRRRARRLARRATRRSRARDLRRPPRRAPRAPRARSPPRPRRPAVPSPDDAFQYAIWRVVPSVERGEALNVGVVVYCRRRQFLAARVLVDEARLRGLSPDLDVDAIAATSTAWSAWPPAIPPAEPSPRWGSPSASAGSPRPRRPSSSPPRSTPACAGTHRRCWIGCTRGWSLKPAEPRDWRG